MIRTRTTGRRRGQGMTEYIIIVGLIAIGLIAAVGHFRDQIDKTIQGSDGGQKEGMAGGVNSMHIGQDPGGGGGGGGGTFTTRSGNTVSNGNYTSGPNTGQPWNPTTDPR
jgi:hypothetical protein